MDFPGGSDGKSICLQCGRPRVRSPGQEEPLGEGNGNPLQYSCLENPMDRQSSLVCYSPWGCKESDMTEQLHSHYEGGSIYFLLFYNIWFSFSFAWDPHAFMPTDGLTHSFDTRILTSFTVRVSCMEVARGSNTTPPQPENKPYLPSVREAFIIWRLMLERAFFLISRL